MTTIYYGRIRCQGTTKKGLCQNKAYYLASDKYLCGVHSRYLERITLPKGPKIDQKEQFAKELEVIESVRLLNISHGKKGDIMLTKMRMMKASEHIPGYLNVYPNYKDGKRKDGLGLPSLSPKSIGIVYHNQPNLPPAKNLENLHQFNKVYKCDVDSKGDPNENFYTMRLKGYSDDIPHRHKYDKSFGNEPLYSIWVDNKGKEIRLTYVESRQIYCHYYEKYVKSSEQFIYLKQLYNTGTNLNIVGYDANLINNIFDDYLDDSKPYGHEYVLYAMLTLEPDKYPWKHYKTLDLN